MDIGILAGEASGDLLGAGLISSLTHLQPDLNFTGIGGAKMIEQGCQSLFEMERLSVMGLIEPLLHLSDLLKIRRELFHYFKKNRPAAFVGIDSPDFNLGLEAKLKREGIPVVHYVSPSVWAWRQKRIFKIKKSVDLMLALFPFEEEFYHKHNVPVHYVGHPLADAIPLYPDKAAARKALKLDEEAQYVAILPGSRRNEIKHLAEVFVQTADLCWKRRPKLKFITSAINDNRDQDMREYCDRISPELPIEFYVRRSHEVLAAADCVLVASGTATLETMLYKKPMVIAYKMAALTYRIASQLVKLSSIGLPNILANEKLVPEFIQHAVKPEPMSDALLDFLDLPDRVRMLEQRFLEIHQQLKRNANEQAAKAIMDLIRSR